MFASSAETKKRHLQVLRHDRDVKMHVVINYYYYCYCYCCYYYYYYYYNRFTAPGLCPGLPG